MVSLLDSRVGGPGLGLSPGQGNCIVFLRKNIMPLSMPPRCINGYWCPGGFGPKRIALKECTLKALVP